MSNIQELQRLLSDRTASPEQKAAAVRELMNQAAARGEAREGRARETAGREATGNPDLVGPLSPGQQRAGAAEVQRQMAAFGNFAPGRGGQAPATASAPATAAGPSPVARRQPTSALPALAPPRRNASGLDPNFQAVVDAMTGRRVHRGMDGRPLGQEGVDPSLRYMLMSLRGRRHFDTSGNIIF